MDTTTNGLIFRKQRSDSALAIPPRVAYRQGLPGGHPVARRRGRIPSKQPRGRRPDVGSAEKQTHHEL